MTRCATTTGAGRSAIAVIAVRGAKAADILSKCFQGATKGRFFPGDLRFGVWTGPQSVGDPAVGDPAVGDPAVGDPAVGDPAVGDPAVRDLAIHDPADGDAWLGVAGESVVVTPVDDNDFEIHCHGGPAAIDRILADLQACGATLTEPGRWIRSGQMLLIHEAIEVLEGCLTAKTAAIAMDQVRGAMLNWATKHVADLRERPTTAGEIRRQAEELLGVAGFTTRLTEPFRVVLVGPPNVGKSSLLNAMVGFDRSITLDSPGTTRDLLHADTVVDGLPIRMSDTAGIRQSDHSIEQQGMERARVAAGAADLVLLVVDPPALPGSHESHSSLVSSSKPLIRVLNKSDLLKNDLDRPFDVATNALTGEGVPQLMDLIAARLNSTIIRPGAPAAINARQADLLRKIAAARDAVEIEAGLQELLGVENALG